MQTSTTSTRTAKPRPALRKTKTRTLRIKKQAGHLENFLSWYAHLNADSVQEVREHYTKDLFFKDPLHEFYTVGELQSYMNRLHARLSDIHLVIENRSENGDQAFITWTMTALTMGQKVSIRGVTHFKFDAASGLCEYQRDYFDLAEEVYEQVPLLGLLFKGLKKVLN